MDSHGFVTLKDRSKDLIISGGSNIYPREVEEVLITHPAVREVSVIGRRDADWGEVVVAFVVLDPAAGGWGRMNSTAIAWSASPASNGPRNTVSWMPCRRTITERC
jgi:long-chain acyl-CoA synthetase